MCAQRIEYGNPIIPGFYPDPSVCRVDEDYYLVTSSFEYFPGVPVFHSRDLINWKQIGHCLTRDSQLDLQGVKSSGGVYAPTIRFHDGTFYLVTTDTTGIGNFYVTAEDPAGDWSDPIRVSQQGIDPSLFFDATGKVYFTSNGLDWDRAGIYQCEIDIKTGNRLAHSRLIWQGTGGKYPEAPHLYKKDGWYYLLIAEGGTELGHMVTMARSETPWGPFHPCPWNPIFSHRSTWSPIQSTGHAEIFQDHKGGWWIVFLGVRHTGYPPMHHLGRETHLSPVLWPQGKWPEVNGGKLVELKMSVDGLPPHPFRALEVRDDFSSPQLDLHWNFRRNPAPESWSLEKRVGWLSLECIPATLSEVASPAFVGRRQQHFQCRAETLMEFEPIRSGEEAGITVYMNEKFHYDLYVIFRDGRRFIGFRRTHGSLSVEVFLQEIDSAPKQLKIDAEEEWYRFSFKSPDGVTGDDYTEVGLAETRLIATEIAGGFTGAYFAMYATSSGGSWGSSAHFDWFDYQDTTSGAT